MTTPNFHELRAGRITARAYRGKRGHVAFASVAGSTRWWGKVFYRRFDVSLAYKALRGMERMIGNG